MKKIEISNYNFIKKTHHKDDNLNFIKFFSGLEQFSRIGELKRNNLDLSKVVYSLRYAIIIFIVCIVLLLSVTPAIHKIYINTKYKNLIYNEIIHSYVDSIDVTFNKKKFELKDYIKDIEDNSIMFDSY